MRFVTRRGFTLIETLIVLIVIGTLTLMTFPSIRKSIDKTNVRSAKVAVSTEVSTARLAAIQRSCRAVAHFPATGNVWVTACPRLTAGAGTVDTIGKLVSIFTRYGATLTTTLDSVQFDPRSFSLDNVSITIRLTKGPAKDSVLINTLGKVIR